MLALFILICLFLCLLILVQSDKGGGISGAIGGLSGANNFLGTQDTANYLTKGTYIFGSAFLVLCILMTFTAPGGGGAAKSALHRMAESGALGVTAMPASGMGFADAEEAVPAAEAADGAGAGPVIVGDIIEGGVTKRVGPDGKLVEVEPAPQP
ncbi:MAG: preprotein translocase subunit SecG [Chitinispirillia bacterium]|nr:preprotein translocase subunit SecG [Chitinispirillia bacterium]